MIEYEWNTPQGKKKQNSMLKLEDRKHIISNQCALWLKIFGFGGFPASD